MMFIVMDNLKVILLFFLSTISIEVIGYFKDLNVILFTVIQFIIGVLTIVYLIHRIKLTRNENKKFNSNSSNDNWNINDNISVS